MKYPNSRQCSNLLVLCEEVKNNTPQVVLLLFLNKVCIYLVQIVLHHSGHADI